MTSLPLVSICIPTYNSEAFIRETIESIIHQTYSHLEIVVSDDCSSDSTIDIIKSFDDPRMKLYQNTTNLGVEGNWNKTLHLSSGIYAKVMGADDIIFPNCIEEQVSIFENPDNEDVVLVTSHKEVIDENGRVVISRKFPGRGKINGLVALKRSVRRGTNIIGEPVAGLFRLQILRHSGYFVGKNVYMIDLDFWSRMLKFGNLYVIDKSLYAFRISSGAISTSLGFKQFTSFNNFVKTLFLNKEFKITSMDKFVATCMSFAMVIARNLFYLKVFKSK